MTEAVANSTVLAPAGKRKPPNAGKGRVAGVPNKVTREVRALCQLALDRQEPKIDAWFDRVAKKDPSRALEHFIRLAEICMPRTTTVESTLLAARNDAGQSVVMQRIRAAYGVGEESAVVSSQ